MRLKYTKFYALLHDGFWKNNPVLSSALGICSALAVTNKLANGIAMGLAVTFVVMAASFITSTIRDFIPQRVRMVTYVILISTFVVAVDQFFKAYYPDISRALGPYIALIITNCLIMGRAEAFASSQPAKFSLIDAFSHGMGYTITLIFLSAIRELLAFGTLLEIQIMSETWPRWIVMAMAPGGFFVLALIVWAVRSLQVDQSQLDNVGNTGNNTTSKVA